MSDIHISIVTNDAWKVHPPCEKGDIDHCHQCPHYFDCWDPGEPEIT